MSIKTLSKFLITHLAFSILFYIYCLNYTQSVQFKSFPLTTTIFISGLILGCVLCFNFLNRQTALKLAMLFSTFLLIYVSITDFVDNKNLPLTLYVFLWIGFTGLFWGLFKFLDFLEKLFKRS